MKNMFIVSRSLTLVFALFLSVNLLQAQTQWTSVPSSNNIYNTSLTGNVGIGTATPGANLTVYAASIPSISLSGSYSNTSAQLLMGIATCAGCYSAAATSGDIVIASKAVGSKHLILSAQNGNSGSIKFTTGNTAGDAERMIITSTGTVGIGTSCIPADGKFAVNGKIYATAIQVKATDVNGCFPDYVFSQDYKLRSLSEVENYIQKNQHLPEVPSALEVDKEGINVAEMDVILLKKIEELTLYMIELEKKNKNLEERIRQIEQK